MADPPRLAEVARRAGVSMITASRALRTPEKVAPETRARIQAAVGALGYVTNLVAGALASARTRNVALLVPTIVTLAAMSVLLGLGTWQWQRKAWKEQVIATITARSKAAPIEAGDWLKRDCPNLDQFGIERSCEYLAVRLTGTFDHANERHVYTGIAKPAGGGVGGQGYWIMTPLRISGSNEVVAVSRGSHCLNDLLHRWSTGSLGVDIVGVVSNHDNLRGLTEWHGLPFEKMPDGKTKLILKEKVGGKIIQRVS